MTRHGALIPHVHLPEDNNVRRLLYASRLPGLMLVSLVVSFWFSGIAGRCGSYVDRYAARFRPTRRNFHVVLPTIRQHLRLASTDHAAARCECHSPSWYHTDCLGGDRTLPHAASGRGRQLMMATAASLLAILSSLAHHGRRETSTHELHQGASGTLSATLPC